MILTWFRFASAASSRNLSTRALASSTVIPITLISPDSPSSPPCDVTVMFSREAGFTAVFSRVCPSIPVISSTATFIRNGPASISAEGPSTRRKITALLNPRILHLPPRRFLQLGAQLSFLHRLHHARHVFLEPFLHFGKLLFQLRYPL